MKKGYFYFILILCSFPIFAQPVSKNMAKEKALNEYNLYFPPISEDNLLLSDIIYYNNDSTIPVLYIFNANNNKGFIVLSGTMKYHPVIGISGKGKFDINKPTRNRIFWDTIYIAPIIKTILSDEPADSNIAKQWEIRSAIPTKEETKGDIPDFPLLTTAWAQDYLYASFTPNNAVTGCVATAMAQIMKYYNFPKTGSGSSCYVHNDYGELCADYGQTHYDWANMPSAPRSDDEIKAVGTLMLHAGIAVEMIYGTNSSSAKSADALVAMKKYFNYSTFATII